MDTKLEPAEKKPSDSKIELLLGFLYFLVAFLVIYYHAACYPGHVPDASAFNGNPDGYLAQYDQ